MRIHNLPIDLADEIGAVRLKRSIASDNGQICQLSPTHVVLRTFAMGKRLIIFQSVNFASVSAKVAPPHHIYLRFIRFALRLMARRTAGRKR